MPKTMLSFQVFRGDQLLKAVELSEESVTIGRGGAAILSVDDPGIADLHAVINVNDNGSVDLFDLGSEAGTKVNGLSISNVPLKSGDTVEIGGLRIVVSYVGDFEDEEATQVGGRAPAPKSVRLGAAVVDEESTDPRGVPPEAARLAATDASADEEEEDDHHAPEAPIDMIAILVRSGQVDPAQKNVTRILEINQIWGDVLLDAKHFRKGTPATVGASTNYLWTIFGKPIMGVSAPLNYIVRYLPPLAADAPQHWASDFYAPEKNLPGGRDFNLVSWNGSQHVVNAPNGWDGFVDVGEQRFTFDQMVADGRATRNGDGVQIPMTDETRVAVDAEGLVFFAQMVSPGRRAVTRLTEGLDYPFLAIASIFGFLGGILMLVAALRGPSTNNDSIEIDEKYLELMMEKPPPEEKKGGNPDAGEGAKAKKEEGKVGKKDAKMEKAKGDKIKLEKQQIDKQIVESAGINAAFNDASIASTLGASGLSSDIQGGIGGLIGANGVQIGSGGLGVRGGGLGGGGTAEGLGGLGTKGMGSGASGFGSGGGNFGAKGEGGIGRVGGDPIILGALDRALIDEVVKRHMNQIRYCYQRELVKSNALAGKIVIKFTIAKDGTVSASSTKSTTMNSPAVEKCIEGRFLRMQFPSPKGGGIVLVSYPFVFAPS